MDNEKKQVSFVFEGTATVKNWEGSKDTVSMNKWYGFYPTREEVIKNVNDGDFGCKRIAWAAVHVFKVFENHPDEFVETMIFTSKELQKAGK